MLLIYATRLGHQQRHVLVNFLLYLIIGVLKLVGYFTVKLGSSDPPESRLLALRLLALGLVVLVCAVTDGPS